MNALAQLVCSRVRAEIFRVLFGLHGGELHLREVQRRTGFALGTVRQDIAKLVQLGVVVRREGGNRVYYSANETHPLTPDIRQLALKTSGSAICLPSWIAM
ncbi:MAG: winged helix-turn-helix domain-containing protein [Thermoguttaceae bacterium]|jgi:predicted transcriptional regulator|nr:winged helix-turn-helix domain-containing protein [Thermoguttaceae bacterium]